MCQDRASKVDNIGANEKKKKLLPRAILQRDEKDLVQIQSGVEHGVTLGTPIALLVKNEDQRPRDYSEVHTLLSTSLLPQLTKSTDGPVPAPQPRRLDLPREIRRQDDRRQHRRDQGW